MWVKQYASKRWHKTRRNDPAMALCGKRLIPTREGTAPPWHVACVGCLRVINKKSVAPGRGKPIPSEPQPLSKDSTNEQQ